ncbi:UNKNOWN [Stylonychia lemnae]|uniref:Uncharacterized protein n=1 Tax=Stylonychia lemnae TaxID=5949 RepID=A0A078BAF9_STYLE|nr:UNKNOWN [Stylonychia lemnae]|eukprot:CDW91211.1 UNKNOWN [Stylonychia lemnae]
MDKTSFTSIAYDYPSKSIVVGGYTWDSTVSTFASSSDQHAIIALIDNNNIFKWKKRVSGYKNIEALTFGNDNNQIYALMKSDNDQKIMIVKRYDGAFITMMVIVSYDIMEQSLQIVSDEQGYIYCTYQNSQGNFRILKLKYNGSTGTAEGIRIKNDQENSNGYALQYFGKQSMKQILVGGYLKKQNVSRPFLFNFDSDTNFKVNFGQMLSQSDKSHCFIRDIDLESSSTQTTVHTCSQFQTPKHIIYSRLKYNNTFIVNGQDHFTYQDNDKQIEC